MTNYTKPEGLDLVWASSGITSRPSDFKWLTGWEQEKPPFEQMNYVHNKHDSWAAYSNQKGIPEWDNSTIYYSNSYVQSNGRLYKSKTNQNTNNNPMNDLAEANWRLIFDGNNRLTSEADFTPFGKSLIGTANASSARSLLGSTPIGDTLFTAQNSAAARSVLGFTTTGTNILTATSIDNAQTSLGFSSLGKALIQSANATQAQSYLGFTSFGGGLISRPDAASVRAYIGANNASNLNTGTVPLARLPSSANRPLATQAQVNAGSGSGIVTPTTLRFGVVLSLGVNGGIALPSWLGGIAINWGQVNIARDSQSNVYFQVPYGTGQIYQFMGSFATSGNDQNSGLIFNKASNSHGVIYNNGSTRTRTVSWLAIGRRIV